MRQINGAPPSADGVQRAMPSTTIVAHGTASPLNMGQWEFEILPLDHNISEPLPVPIGDWVRWHTIEGPGHVANGGRDIFLDTDTADTFAFVDYELASTPSATGPSLFHVIVPWATHDWRTGGSGPYLGGPGGSSGPFPIGDDSDGFNELTFATNDPKTGILSRSGPFAFDLAGHVLDAEPHDGAPARGVAFVNSGSSFGEPTSFRAAHLTFRAGYGNPYDVPPQDAGLEVGYTMYLNWKIQTTVTAAVTLTLNVYELPEFAGSLIDIAGLNDPGSPWWDIFRYLTT